MMMMTIMMMMMMMMKVKMMMNSSACTPIVLISNLHVIACIQDDGTKTAEVVSCLTSPSICLFYSMACSNYMCDNRLFSPSQRLNF